jgi:hypothetical protein
VTFQKYDDIRELVNEPIREAEGLKLTTGGSLLASLGPADTWLASLGICTHWLAALGGLKTLLFATLSPAGIGSLHSGLADTLVRAPHPSGTALRGGTP